MKFVPSPIDIMYHVKYQALANKSGRMQYYKKEPGKGRLRIARNDFINAYNNSEIIALHPLQSKGKFSVFQMEFFVRNSK